MFKFLGFYFDFHTFLPKIIAVCNPYQLTIWIGHTIHSTTHAEIGKLSSRVEFLDSYTQRHKLRTAYSTNDYRGKWTVIY